MIDDLSQQIDNLIKLGLDRGQAEEIILNSFKSGVRASLYRREARKELEAIEQRRANVRSVT